MSPERFQQVDRVLQSVLERPAEERETFLEAACGSDSSLKREVRSLLAAYDDSGSFIERPAVEDGARLLADAREASLVGQTIGNYRVGTFGFTLPSSTTIAQEHVVMPLKLGGEMEGT